MLCQTKMFVYIVKKIAFLSMCCVLLSDSCTTMSVNDAMKNSKVNRTLEHCEPLPSHILTQIHGPAFDGRFMSIDIPPDNDEIIVDTFMGIKRDTEQTEQTSFYITNDFEEVLSKSPAWNIDWDTLRKENVQMSRKKRSLQHANYKRQPDPWLCEKRFTWLHLGPDYYPSHLRTVECTQPNCYFKQYDCVPRKFTVRILQRRRGVCSDEHDAEKLKLYGFEGKLAEVWEFVSHTVNFCCDCVRRPDTHRYD